MGRIVPVNDSPGSTASTRQQVESPRVVPRGVHVQDRFFELRLAHDLPTVDLSRTPARSLLSPVRYDWFVGVARNQHDAISRFTRGISLLYLGILFFHSPLVRECITYVLLLSALPLVFVAGLLSLDVISALVKTSYEYWFLSLLNAVHWLWIGLVFHDVRSFMCIVSCLAMQIALTLDANFRTFAAATKTVGAGIPSMILLGVLCSMRYVADGRTIVVHYRHFAFSSGDVVAFTASTLAIFMTKLAVRKHLSKSGLSSLDSAIVYCVMLKARLELAPRRDPQRRKQRVTIRAIPSAFGTISTSARQPVKAHGLAKFVVDAHRTLVPGALTHVWHRSRVSRLALYSTGALGAAATTAVWIAILGVNINPDSEVMLVLSAAGAGCSLTFVSLFLRLMQRDLLWTLAFTFDFNFSVFQAVSLALSLADMSRWQPAVCLAALGWWLWFQWVLLLDAVTPAARRRLGFSKKLAAPVMVLVLLGALLLAARIVHSDSRMGFDPHEEGEDLGPITGLLRNRRLIHWSPSPHHDVELRTFEFSLQRVLTILCWSSRLAMALATGSEHELLFVRGFTRYATPFETFPANSNASARRRNRTERNLAARVSRVLPVMRSGGQGGVSLRLASIARGPNLCALVKAPHPRRQRTGG